MTEDGTQPNESEMQGTLEDLDGTPIDADPVQATETNPTETAPSQEVAPNQETGALDQLAGNKTVQVAATKAAHTAIEALTPKQEKLIEKAMKLREEALSKEGNVGHLAIAWSKLSPEDRKKFVEKYTSTTRKVVKEAARLTNVDITLKVLQYTTPVVAQISIISKMYGAARNRFLPYADFMRSIEQWDKGFIIKLIQLGALDCEEDVARMIDESNAGESKVKSLVLAGISAAFPQIAPVAGVEGAYLNKQAQKNRGMAAVREFVRRSQPTPNQEEPSPTSEVSSLVSEQVQQVTGSEDSSQELAA